MPQTVIDRRGRFTRFVGHFARRVIARPVHSEQNKISSTVPFSDCHSVPFLDPAFSDNVDSIRTQSHRRVFARLSSAKQFLFLICIGIASRGGYLRTACFCPSYHIKWRGGDPY